SRATPRGTARAPPRSPERRRRCARRARRRGRTGGGSGGGGAGRRTPRRRSPRRGPAGPGVALAASDGRELAQDGADVEEQQAGERKALGRGHDGEAAVAHGERLAVLGAYVG